MYQELLKEWIKTIPSKENRKYLKESVELAVFAEWLDNRAAQQSMQADVLEWCGCEGYTPTMENGKCSACGKNAHR